MHRVKLARYAAKMAPKCEQFPHRPYVGDGSSVDSAAVSSLKVKLCITNALEGSGAACVISAGTSNPYLRPVKFHSRVSGRWRGSHFDIQWPLERRFKKQRRSRRFGSTT